MRTDLFACWLQQSHTTVKPGDGDAPVADRCEGATDGVSFVNGISRVARLDKPQLRLQPRHAGTTDRPAETGKTVLSGNELRNGWHGRRGK